MFKLLLAWPFLSASTQPAPVPEATLVTTSTRSLEAFKTDFTPRIDGSLDDECWKRASVVSGFIVSQPEYGKPASQQSEVKVLYDDNAIYIGAHLFDTEPSKIQKQISNRDDANANADLFVTGLDTYDDNLNGYRFGVTAAGVQIDSRISGTTVDDSWDAVWFSKVTVVNDGWVVELKIPFSAIRFAKKDDQQWGLQFSRLVRRTNEVSAWSPSNPQVNGYVNQWGELYNLCNLNPPLRLSFIPYLNVGIQREPVSYNPKAMANRRLLSGGMDINWGINESFTLNTTLIPDFGQVQSDNVVLNLGPFEQQFQERRPFFTEGTELFNRKVGRGPGQLFYSRRIGGMPALHPYIPYTLKEEEEVESNPSVTQLYNATKVSGRTKKGLGIGMINAIASPMYARIKNTVTDETRRELTEPLTNYNIFVLDQSLKNNSRIGFTNTNVIRKGEWRDANVSSFNFSVRDKSNTFSYSGFANLSQVYDKSISSQPQLGVYADYGFSKISGNVRVDFEQYVITDKYDQNDMGILFHGNEVSNFIGLMYFDYKPKGKVNNSDCYISLHQTSLYKPFAHQDFNINAGADLVFTNFWYWGTFFQTKPIKYYDYYEARTPGVKFLRNPYVYLQTYAGSDSRKPFSVEWSLGFGESPVPKDPYMELSVTPTLRIKDRIKLSYNVFLSNDWKNFGFAAFDEEGNPMMGARKLYNVINTFNAQYSITPLMYVTFRARHYWSKALYTNHYNLDEDGNIHEREMTQNTTRNFNTWNIDLVYNWQFAPGSNLIVTWKQNINQADNEAEGGYAANVYKTFTTPQTNMVALKVIYYLDYQQMKEWDAKRKNRKQQVG